MGCGGSSAASVADPEPAEKKGKKYRKVGGLDNEPSPTKSEKSAPPDLFATPLDGISTRPKPEGPRNRKPTFAESVGLGHPYITAVGEFEKNKVLTTVSMIAPRRRLKMGSTEMDESNDEFPEHSLVLSQVMTGKVNVGRPPAESTFAPHCMDMLWTPPFNLFLLPHQAKDVVAPVVRQGMFCALRSLPYETLLVNHCQPRRYYGGNLRPITSAPRTVFSLALSPDERLFVAAMSRGRTIVQGPKNLALPPKTTPLLPGQDPEAAGQQQQPKMSGYMAREHRQFMEGFNHATLVCDVRTGNTVGRFDSHSSLGVVQSLTFLHSTGDPSLAVLGVDAVEISTVGKKKSVPLKHREPFHVLQRCIQAKASQCHRFYAVCGCTEGDNMHDIRGHVLVWRAYSLGSTDFRQLTEFLEHPATVTAFDYHPTEDLIISADELGFVMVWDLDTAECYRKIKAHYAPISQITWTGLSSFITLEPRYMRCWERTAVFEDSDNMNDHKYRPAWMRRGGDEPEAALDRERVPLCQQDLPANDGCDLSPRLMVRGFSNSDVDPLLMTFVEPAPPLQGNTMRMRKAVEVPGDVLMVLINQNKVQRCLSFSRTFAHPFPRDNPSLPYTHDVQVLVLDKGTGEQCDEVSLPSPCVDIAPGRSMALLCDTRGHVFSFDLYDVCDAVVTGRGDRSCECARTCYCVFSPMPSQCHTSIPHAETPAAHICVKARFCPLPRMSKRAKPRREAFSSCTTMPNPSLQPQLQSAILVHFARI